jgi:hypothetical protein
VKLLLQKSLVFNQSAEEGEHKEREREMERMSRQNYEL